jgi:hypothetical protein
VADKVDSATLTLAVAPFTRAEQWQMKEAKGVWRKARKERHCQRYWRDRVSGCAGNGLILAGERYFDLQELDGSAGGFGTFCVCQTCASEASPNTTTTPA